MYSKCTFWQFFETEVVVDQAVLDRINSNEKLSVYANIISLFTNCEELNKKQNPPVTYDQLVDSRLRFTSE